MAYSPRFSYSEQLVRNLMQVEGGRAIVEVLPLPPDVGLRLRQEARSRSTHHSTKIEGNRLRETAVPSAVLHPATKRGPDEVEVRNYWRALEWIEIQCDRTPVSITEETIRTLHAIILPPLQGRPPKMNNYRTQEVGVVDAQRGDYEYMAPEPRDVPALMSDLAEWLASSVAMGLPGPVRAAILAYQFLTIHPFMDGNGRTARALATMELWRSGYGMRGFLSIEEYYTRDIARYYSMLQMGLPANYYKGRNNPDMTPWVAYFGESLANAVTDVSQRAITLYRETHPRERYPWEQLTRLQQQLLSRCLSVAIEGKSTPTFKPGEVAAWFSVSDETSKEWLHQWSEQGFVRPASGAKRIREWKLGAKWEQVVMDAAAERGK